MVRIPFQAIEQKQAEERLLARSKLSAKVLAETYGTAAENPAAFKTYREKHAAESEDDEEEELDSDDEVHDLDDEPGGGVNIVVYDK